MHERRTGSASTTSRSRGRRLALAAGLTAAAMATGGLVGIQPAAAYPSGCSAGLEGNGSYAFCSSGSGQFRAWVTCHNSWVGSPVKRWGPWKTIGVLTEKSFAKCGSQEFTGSFGYATLG
jgi:hypothetical protein